MRVVEKRLREHVKALKIELEVVRKDREKHREYWIRILRKTIEHQGKGTNFNNAILIESLARHLNEVENWWWS